MRTFLRTWVLTSFGGAACGVLCASIGSVVYSVVTAPYAFCLAAVVGLPVVLALSIWLTFARPDPDPRPFIRRLAVIGSTIALVINGTTNMVFLGAISSALTANGPVVLILAMPFAVAATVAAIAASGLVGWVCGATLAHRQLIAVSHPEAAARTIARRRRPWR